MATGNSKTFLAVPELKKSCCPEGSSKMEYSNLPSWRQIIKIHVDLFFEDMILIFQIFAPDWMC